MRSPSRRYWLLAGSIAGLAAAALERRRNERATTRRVEALRSAADRQPSQGPDGRDDLPDPVARYFETVIDTDRPVHAARLEQDGEFRLGGRDSDWKPMTATQDYTVDPPGFVWDARIELAPLLTAHVVDAYEFGRGSLRATLFGLLPVAEADPGPELDEGELLRYLAEAVWFPTALLPGAGVEWEAIDDRSARATIEDRGTTATAVFQFDETGLVERVRAERWRQEDERYAPWEGQYEAYESHDGLWIPTEASVAWDLPDGPVPYWRASIGGVEYRRA